MNISVNITNLWRRMNIDKYLYEIIDKYKTSDSDEEKNDLFESFCSSIWSSNNKRRTYNKTITYHVKDSLLDAEIGKIFDVWSVIEYKGYKSMTKNTDWASLIRQKVNNLYTRYFDRDVILKAQKTKILERHLNTKIEDEIYEILLSKI